MSLVERRLRELGFRIIAGADEVGRGCLAGPVVAAAVILDGDATIPGVRDSKLLSPPHRLAVCRTILRHARAAAIGIVEPRIIDEINILQASKLAIQQAVVQLFVRPEVLLVDAICIDRLEMPQLPLIEGDRRSVSVAAASVVAKVYRDQLMESYHACYPQYDFVHNRGYGTENHWAALKKFGPTPIHRMSFEGLSEPRLFE